MLVCLFVYWITKECMADLNGILRSQLGTGLISIGRSLTCLLVSSQIIQCKVIAPIIKRKDREQQRDKFVHMFSRAEDMWGSLSGLLVSPMSECFLNLFSVNIRYMECL